MKWLKKLFGKAAPKPEVPPMPSWEETVDIMYDKSLGSSELLKVIYSNDKTKRYILYKSDRGYYKYTYEMLHGFDEAEWVYVVRSDNYLPGYWQEASPSCVSSFFGTEEEAM